MASSAACARPAEPPSRCRQRPASISRALRRLRAATAPPRTSALLRLFARLDVLRRQRAQLRLLVGRARRFTPEAGEQVARLARSDPDAALETFVSAFQRQHFELDEAVCEEGFEFWADAAAESIPIAVRGHDRCNGLEPFGYRPGYALLWALIEDVFWDDQRTQLLGEVADAFGGALADRLAMTDPPEHRVLCRRLARSPYAGLVAFSRWVLGDVRNEVLLYPAHHAHELAILWTKRGVARATRLLREADAFEAPILGLARWLEHAPAVHAPLLVDAALGRQDTQGWDRAAIRPCPRCGFPPAPRNWEEATSPRLLPDPAIHGRVGRPRSRPATPFDEGGP